MKWNKGHFHWPLTAGRTRIIIVLMYALVFLVCFGVLYAMDHLMKTSQPVSTFTSVAVQTETQPAAETEEDRFLPPRPSASSQAAEEPQRPSLEYRYESWTKKTESVWTPPQETESPYVPPKLVLATDLHYQSAAAGDGGEAYQKFVESCDGKVVDYLPQLLEAFIDEVIEERPSALVLSGDITMNGEKMNHQELAHRLKRVREAGIQVLVIPGNHDINNDAAAVYYGKEAAPAESVTSREFYEIYRDYGYDQAFSRDETSLSYAYALDDKNWLLMLDSAQYSPRNRVEGRLLPSTLQWMEGILKEAGRQGILVIPIAHHNLLSQSRMYTRQCTMENYEQAVELLQRYRVPLFFSGHLHVQRMRKYKSEPGVPDAAYGIQEIVTDALSIPPCQYGELNWQEDGSLEYSTRAVNVSAWASRNGLENEDLLHFEDWSYRYIQKLISSQIGKLIQNLGDDITDSMSGVYAQVYMDYYAGRAIDKEQVKSTKGYRWWERNMPDSHLLREINAMMEDADRDYNYFMLPFSSAPSPPAY